MMKRRIKSVAIILTMLLTGAAVQAELQLAENFEDPSMTGDGSNLTGVLGGIFDTQSEGTGNHAVESQNGSRLVQYRGHSSGTSARGWAISGLDNPIENTEVGTLFFRFTMRVDSAPAYNWYGIHDFPADTDNPLTGSTDEPEEIVAGFMLRSVSGAQADIDIRTPDEAIFLRKVVKGQWYNVWVVADNTNDTYDLFMNDAEGPAGPPPAPPSDADQLLSGHPFNKATDEPLAGMMTFFPGRMPPGFAAAQTARYWTDEIWWDGDLGLKAPTTASAPDPANEISDVNRDVVLTWKASDFAASHDVYFGTSFDDVSNGVASALVGDGITEASFDLPRLDFAQTYFWRVDEVNSAPDFTVFAGSIWTFTSEPLSIPITGITTTASSSFGVSVPGNTINGSGLVDDLHGISAGDMWVSTAVPATIEYAFDKAFKLHELWIWNSNQLIESFVGFGAKDVVIEHSLDGENWAVLDGVEPLAQGPGAAGYAHNNTIDLGGVVAQHVRLTINSVHGIAPQTSLSEVRFFYIPTAATRPSPETGASDVAPDVTLSWARDGREAGRHEIYLGSDPGDLALAGTVNESSFDTLASDLQLGQTYHWRVDEVNETMNPSVWQSETWSFTTTETVLIDDMESYEDAEFLEIWATWIDGFDDPANGSLVGANPVTGDFSPESGFAHGGRQSLPIWFDNSTVAFSEATRTFDQTQDWSRFGVHNLVVSFLRGGENIGNGVLYVKINDTKAVYQEDATSLPPGWDVWTQWKIDLTGLGTDLSRVRSLTIGIEGAAAKGVLYVDDIHLDGDAAPAASKQVLTWFEAESGAITAPLRVFADDTTASGGEHIGTEDGSGNENDNPPADGVATYSISLAEDGVYSLAFRTIVAGGNDSFWVRIPGMATNTSNHASGWVRFNEIQAGDAWHWDEVHSNDDGNQVVEFTLPAGTHALEIARREDGTLLDAIAIMK